MTKPNETALPLTWVCPRCECVCWMDYCQMCGHENDERPEGRSVVAARGESLSGFPRGHESFELSEWDSHRVDGPLDVDDQRGAVLGGIDTPSRSPADPDGADLGLGAHIEPPCTWNPDNFIVADVSRRRCPDFWNGQPIPCAVGCRTWDECCGKSLASPCGRCKGTGWLEVQRD